MNPLAIWLLCSFCFLLGFLVCGILVTSRRDPLPPSDIEQKDTLDDTADAEITAEWETIFCDRR